MTSLTTLALLVALSGEVELTTLDGDVVAGELATWTDGEIAIGETTVSLQEAHFLRFGEAATLADATQVVRLRDGSRFVASSFSRTSDRAEMEVLGSGCSLPASELSAIRFAVLEERFTTAWKDLIDRERRDDYFARVRGESLDHVDCIVGTVDAEVVNLRVGERDLAVPLDKAFGLLFSTRPLSGSRVAGRVTLVDGSILMASALKWGDDELALETPSGLSLDVPAEHLAEVDLAAGRLTLLSGIEPRSVQYAPFGDNYDEYAWQIRVGRNALGDRLRLNGRPHADGLWIHSGTTVIYSLPPRAVRLQATVGIDELSVPGAPVKLEVLADGRQVFSDTIVPDAPQSLDLEVRDVRLLTIVASTTKPDGHGIREHLAVVDARLILE